VVREFQVFTTGVHVNVVTQNIAGHG